MTRFGRFLRATSLDELPQLWNILCGEMSFVGPRPFTPDQTHLYQGGAYYLMKPGLTGYWQVGRRNDASFSERAVDDARYAREMSLATDLRVMLKTVKVVLAGTGY
jgi:lipopolysaccharide/colanic/teichoic acid biosynthesis glycosyltransferase